ncbi:hypothetical protein [Polaromonas sp.]|uniref:hypothetical protein n=1 Tax=Polaromonas sp. TaxID=1869339 RepID=UPI0017D79844|nr:hypothetical protein [Polaromonas sp.]NML86074.1 hypothetical protein [Polaromonas sp.]
MRDWSELNRIPRSFACCLIACYLSQGRGDPFQSSARAFQIDIKAKSINNFTHGPFGCTAQVDQMRAWLDREPHASLFSVVPLHNRNQPIVGFPLFNQRKKAAARVEGLLLVKLNRP